MASSIGASCSPEPPRRSTAGRCRHRQVMRDAEPRPESPSPRPEVPRSAARGRRPSCRLPAAVPAASDSGHLRHSLPQGVLNDRQPMDGLDHWKYSWGNSIFSTSRAYKILTAGDIAHPVFHWIWKSKCQMKHKVFFWLLLKDRLSTRDLLQRKDMHLESYTCDLCILQRPETSTHLFLRCNFAKACWNSIGVSYIPTRTVFQIFKKIKEKLELPFFMEIIILMAWSIWLTRNDWIFNNLDPSVEGCRRKFKKEFGLLLHRAKPSLLPAMEAWVQEFQP